MTLKEWCEKYNVLPTHPTTERGAVSLILHREGPGHTALHELTDYRVSSKEGGEYSLFWLLPRKRNTALRAALQRLVTYINNIITQYGTSEHVKLMTPEEKTTFDKLSNYLSELELDISTFTKE